MLEDQSRLLLLSDPQSGEDLADWSAVHALIANLADNSQPIATQVSFTTDQSDLARPHPRQLTNEIEALVSGQLFGASLAGARAAVLAFEITC